MRLVVHLLTFTSGGSYQEGKDIRMQIVLKGTPEGVRLSPACVFSGGLKGAVKLLKREVGFLQETIQRIGKLLVTWPWFMVAEMAPKNVRNLADKPEGAHQVRVAKEDSDGRLTGKRLTGGSSKIGCKTSGGAGAGAVKDGRDQFRGVQPDNKIRDRIQNKTQPIITDFLTYGDQVSGAAGPIPLSKNVPNIVEEALWGACHGEKGLDVGKGLAESGPDFDKPQDCVEG
ncbi:hypothetical protein NDU88_006773 [Pleurodeles waltl]|uniref:Uncharacterized protein n=1 Tax=Pleurodeles waltl TaxID=8319 RepID=A0AAV7ME74_PLEWA|nr:hypothetical protein NDU88_006773 [Pleurodeles waltl]